MGDGAENVIHSSYETRCRAAHVSFFVIVHSYHACFGPVSCWARDSDRSMGTSDDDFWRRFDELDRRRRSDLQKREEALKRLDPATAHSGDSAARAAWLEYCESVERLEQSVAELERLIWSLG
jgi:hypothetical protein